MDIRIKNMVKKERKETDSVWIAQSDKRVQFLFPRLLDASKEDAYHNAPLYCNLRSEKIKIMSDCNPTPNIN